ncbi:uncharacterized protein LACBIDRAFT_321023 [Laccaria bicolor S238N-H82]|uniref:Predicted protein n=1 Tax=Laccaria bicolor (strain S238N-H82 / ATCC MYA-4686) TaxID=486041 RepID=B0CNI9_LACBS|nr:uncharacterized protein LACBIDRAFT_321023 [Laccaria bicolor S238N-H82]EDR15316.1 predicted protein [Laccaria bicolor S238N-H82]|eukprot:XP_001873524.1 predicted protein [Laccaria bicolor S238N-H82]
MHSVDEDFDEAQFFVTTINSARDLNSENQKMTTLTSWPHCINGVANHKKNVLYLPLNVMGAEFLTPNFAIFVNNMAVIMQLNVQQLGFNPLFATSHLTKVLNAVIVLVAPHNSDMHNVRKGQHLASKGRTDPGESPNMAESKNAVI